jgi:hypothetical protein
MITTATQTKPTHIQSRRNAAIRCEQHVMNLLDWSLEDYTWFKYETGLRYLNYYTKNCQAIYMLERSQIFWSWWKNHWTIREEEWLLGFDKLQTISPRIRLRDYRAQHNAGGLAQEIFPNAKILGDSYAEMMQQVIDESLKIQVV